MNVFEYSDREEMAFKSMMNECGLEPKTTFFSDLSIAEFIGGEKGIRDTYKRVLKEWMDNVEFITEFLLSLNWKCWEWYDRGKDDYMRLYKDLYETASDKVFLHYEGDNEKTAYILRMLD